MPSRSAVGPVLWTAAALGAAWLAACAGPAAAVVPSPPPPSAAMSNGTHAYRAPPPPPPPQYRETDAGILAEQRAREHVPANARMGVDPRVDLTKEQLLACAWDPATAAAICTDMERWMLAQ